MDTNQISVENVRSSFQLAKKDIYVLYKHVNIVKKEIEELKRANTHLTKQLLSKPIKKSTKKVVRSTKRTTKTYVASKTGKKVHQANCLFARNIKKGNRVLFRTKTKALNENYKLCSCLAY